MGGLQAKGLGSTALLSRIFLFFEDPGLGFRVRITLLNAT